jgi:hypothetical protein
MKTNSPDLWIVFQHRNPNTFSGQFTVHFELSQTILSSNNTFDIDNLI